MTAEVQMVRVDHLVVALKDLRNRHLEQGRVSHAAGVQTAVNLVKREVRRSAALSVAEPATSSAHTHSPALLSPAGP